ncbi:hypothetical protein V8F20_011298 [Naviculisporaceae sp. PSN 640]
MSSQRILVVDQSRHAAHGDIGFGLFVMALIAIIHQLSIALGPIMVYSFLFTFSLLIVLKAICEVVD